MMETNTDRLYWIMTSLILSALFLTITIKVFPQATANVTAPLVASQTMPDAPVHTMADTASDTIARLK